MLEYVTYKQKFVPPHILELLCNLADKNPTPTTVGYGSQQNIKADYRNTGRHHIPSLLLLDIHKTVTQIHDSMLLSKYNSQIKSIEESQLLSYGIGGKYDPHNDSEDFINNKLTRVVPRDWTMIWYLNDNYQGGHLEFCRLNMRLTPKAGDMIIFPSYAEFEHAVIPVSEGTRKCLVTWIETEKRIYERPI